MSFLVDAIQVGLMLFSWKIDTHPPPHNANNIDLYTFSGKFETSSHPHYDVT